MFTMYQRSMKEHGLCSLEVRGQRGGLSERDGTVRSGIKKDTGIMLVYGGIPLNDYISVHKISLLKEMGRNQECLALLKSIQPKIKNQEVQKALAEMEAELSSCSKADDVN